MAMLTQTLAEFPSDSLVIDGVYADGDPTLSMGMVVTPLVELTATALRWYAVAGVTASPRIWTSSRVLLASGPAVLCADGWNTLPLDAPLVLEAGESVIAGVYQVGKTYSAKADAFPVVNDLIVASYGRYLMGEDNLGSRSRASAVWYGVDVVYVVPQDDSDEPVPPSAPTLAGGVYPEAARQLAATVLVDEVQIYNVGEPVTVGFKVERQLTPVGQPVAGLVQTTNLANAVESRTVNVYSVKVAQGTQLKAGQAVKVRKCVMEPSLVGKVLLLDKVSQNGLAMIRKAVASDFDNVNQQGKEGLK